MGFVFHIFDVETNGLAPSYCSVLSFSALQVCTYTAEGRRHFEVQKEFDRYYFPIEPYNQHAIAVNGLTETVIKERRFFSRSNYPLYFNKDMDALKFCQKADLGVCHNVRFDAGFIKKAHRYEYSRYFCTMSNFTSYCSIPHHYHGIKWPKLEEAVQIICGRNDFEFHNSLADCYAVLEILKIMGNSNESNGSQSWSNFFDGIYC